MDVETFDQFTLSEEMVGDNAATEEKATRPR